MLKNPSRKLLEVFVSVTHRHIKFGKWVVVVYVTQERNEDDNNCFNNFSKDPDLLGQVGSTTTSHNHVYNESMIPNMPRTGISVYKLTLPESSSCGGVNVALLVTFKKRSKSFDCRLLVVISIPLKSL